MNRGGKHSEQVGRCHFFNSLPSRSKKKSLKETRREGQGFSLVRGTYSGISGAIHQSFLSPCTNVHRMRTILLVFFPKEKWKRAALWYSFSLISSNQTSGSSSSFVYYGSLLPVFLKKRVHSSKHKEWKNLVWKKRAKEEDADDPAFPFR